MKYFEHACLIAVSTALSLIITEYRINDLRGYIVKQAIQEGIASGAEVYKKKYLADEKLNESLAVSRRKSKDAALKKYVQRLDSILEAK